MALKIAAALSVFLLTVTQGTAQERAPGCEAAEPICAVSSRVFAVSGFDPVGSAVLIEPGLLVTNRHVVADNARAEIYLSNGQTVGADVVPSSYPGDLILLRTDALPEPASTLSLGDIAKGGKLQVIGADIGRGAIRVYAPGRARLLPPKDKPLARLHHDAQSQPGNSGGAVVDDQGRLVAIAASGGEGRNEAIPAAEIAKLREMSGLSHLTESGRAGTAVRRCANAINNATAARQPMNPGQIAFLKDTCLATGNRQYFDLAAQALGQRRHIGAALELLQASLDQDPNALNSRLSLVVTLHLAGRYQEELPHIRELLKHLPANPQVLRFAIQAGAWAGDDALADEGMRLMRLHHPRLAPVAERFRNKPPPAPTRRAPAN